MSNPSDADPSVPAAPGNAHLPRGFTDDPSASVAEGFARPSVAERTERGRSVRAQQPRRTWADWAPAGDRPDPVAVLEGQIPSRLQALIPERHRRMLASPFAFYRGGAAIMAGDLGSTTNSGLAVQACGDAHLANFGMFGSPERALVFDLNDFDETHPGPFEWDVVRLAVSAVLLGRDRGWDTTVQDQLVDAAVRNYRTATRDFAQMSNVDIWYSRLTVEEIEQDESDDRGRRRIERAAAKARANDLHRAVEKFTEVVDGRRRFRDDPPLLHRIDSFYEGADRDRLREGIRTFFLSYLQTLPSDVQVLMSHYRLLDEALKVVGVGSVGTRCFVALGEGRDDQDLYILQIKEAQQSVLAPYWPGPLWAESRTEGQRVVDGQRIMQAASDPLLGWARMGHHDYYLRQFRDMKGSVDLTRIRVEEAEHYLARCGWTLARAHARSGDVVAVAGYLGAGDVFDRSVGQFSRTYADLVEQDYEAFAAAASSGRIEVAPEPAD